MDTIDRARIVTAITDRWENEHGIAGFAAPEDAAHLADLAVEAMLTALPRFSEVHPLIDAYHALYNYKDDAPHGGHLFVTAYQAIRAIEELLVQADIPFTKRYDRDRERG